MMASLKSAQQTQTLFKMRLMAVCAVISSYLFYYFMVTIYPGGIDNIPGRSFIAAFAGAFLVTTYIPRIDTRWLHIGFNIIALSYLALYMDLLHINEWSVFHRWSYFVTGAIMCSVSMTWSAYLLTAVIAVGGPVILGFWSPLSALELIHFHATNLTTFGVIGISVRSNYRYQEQVMMLTDHAIQSSKMAALGQMAGGVAHEINNPLMIIIGTVSQILRTLEADQQGDRARVFKLLARLESTAMRISRVIQSLLIFARQESRDASARHDVRKIVNQSLDLCREKLISAGVELIYVEPSEPVYAHCHSNQISQVIVNLLNNAFDACVTVSRPKIVVELKAIQGNVIVSVQDSGRGVPKELRTKIMEPFFTTKEVGHGTGLGLSVSLGLAQANGGDLILDYDNSPSCFVLKLPQVATAVEVA